MSRAVAFFRQKQVSVDALKLGPTLWGGKGHGLIQMCADNLPVPPGFVISTEVCKVFQKNPPVAMEAIGKALPEWLEMLKEHFGYMPLLSVRSGAPVSMPGMMDTVLNVGITDATREAWVQRIGAGCTGNSEARLHEMFKKVVGTACPADATQQVLDCIAAVFNSWNSARAIEYRKLNDIPDTLGTAVVVQAMVFGNAGTSSGTGVAFTRDPSTGEARIVGEFLANAQGEDVVAGTHKPGPLTDIRKHVSIAAYNTLMKLLRTLDEKHRDMQDVEFTIQEGEVYILQTRAGKRSAAAAFRVVTDLVNANVISLAEARERVTFQQFVTAQRPALNLAATEKALGKAAASGIAGSIGVAVGRAVFNTTDQNKFSNDPLILIRHETTPDDIALMAKSAGILTATGGFTSHAAVVARGMNIPCVTGCGQLVLSAKHATIKLNHDAEHVIAPGDWMTVDGASGKVWIGKGVTSQDADGAAIKFVQQLANEEGLRVRTSTPTSRAYCTAADAPNKTLWAMTARHVEDAVLDLRGLDAWLSEDDAKYVSMLGATDDSAVVAGAVAALCEVKAGNNVQVILPDNAPASLYTNLEKAGYLPVRAVNALDDAFQGKGVLRLGPQLQALAGGEKGLAFLRKALENEGVKFADDDDRGVSVFEAARKLLAA